MISSTIHPSLKVETVNLTFKRKENTLNPCPVFTLTQDMADKCQWALKRNDYKLHTFPFSFLLHIDLKRGLLVMMYVCSYITAHMRGVGNLGLRHTLAKYCRHSSSARLSLHLLHTAFHPLSLNTID